MKSSLDKDKKENELWVRKKEWKEKIKHIKIPDYLQEDLEEYFKYVQKDNRIMYLLEIDNVLASINVACQEKDLTLEEAKYIRKVL